MIAKIKTSSSYIKEKVEFLDASELIGFTTSQTESAIKSSLGTSTRVACIGPAGENLVRYASISNDGGRQAGRCGLGAVMGSKKLKAVVVKPTKKIMAQIEKKKEEALDEKAMRPGIYGARPAKKGVKKPSPQGTAREEAIKKAREKAKRKQK